MVTLAACRVKKTNNGKDDVRTYLVGVASDTEENPTLADGSLNLNSFQHIAWLNNYNRDNKKDLTPIGFTIISPFWLYSGIIENPKELKDGDVVGIC